MTEEKEMMLKELLLTNVIVWIAGDNSYRKVRTIGNMYDEPSKCAIFDDSTYVALYNVGIEDFFILKEIK